MVACQDEVFVKVRSLPEGGHYVYWETQDAFGSFGSGLSRGAAVLLAEKLRTGEVPMTEGDKS